MEHRIPTNTAARRATDRLRTAGTRRGRAAAAAPVAARVVYGAALLLAPDAVIGTVAGAPPGDAVRRLGRVLGTSVMLLSIYPFRAETEIYRASAKIFCRSPSERRICCGISIVTG